MTISRWKGRAVTTKRVATVQVTAYDAATTYSLSRNAKTISTIAAGSANATATALAAAWNASTEQELVELTAVAATDTVTFTNDADVLPSGSDWGVITPSVSGGAGTIGAVTTTTANSGPSDVSVATNYDSAAVPGGGDTLIVDNSEIPLLYNLDQSGAGTLTLLQIDLSMTADVGLPEVNEENTEYLEDRQRYWKRRASSLIIGRGPGGGSGRVMVDSDSVQTAAVVEGSGSGEDSLEAVLWKGTHAANTLTIKGSSSVGVAVYGGEVATLASLTVRDEATVRIGAGVTLAAVIVYGGTLDIYCAVSTSIIMYGGTITVHGSGAVALAQVWGGTLVYNTVGTLGGACVVGENGLIDFSQDPRPKTVTNPIDSYRVDPVRDGDKVVANLRIDFNGIEPISGIGADVRITRGATA